MSGSKNLTRTAEIHRRTVETQIRVSLDVDGRGRSEVRTGIGMFDHMLQQIAKHGRFDIVVEAMGDLEVDAHHLVEDVGICLGRAFEQALGDRRGIVRLADATVPLDDVLAQVAVDCSGRGYFVFSGEFSMERVGQLPTQLVPHFFRSFAMEAKLNLHARLIAGFDDHHRVEALFKALARALDQATTLDPRIADDVPSTKGTVTG